MLRRILLLLVSGGAAALLAGCTSSTNPGTNTNSNMDAALQGVVAADETADPNASGVMDADEITDDPAGAPVLVGPLAAVPDTARVIWWRTLTSTNFAINGSGTADSEYVTAQRNNTGLFHGRLRRHAQADSVLYDKPYGVSWSRAAIYKKVAGLTGEEGTHWMLNSLTLSRETQTSPTGQAPAITSVEVTDINTGGTATFTDPGQMYEPGSLPQFGIGDSVRVKVVTDGNFDSRLAFIHFDINASDRGRTWRRPLTYVGTDGAFEGSFKVREGYGRRHFRLLRARSAVWVDVLTRASIYDTDPGFYGVAGWGLPYRLFRVAGAVAVNQ